MDKTQPILWMIDRLGPGGAEQLMPGILKQLTETGFNVRVCVLKIRHGNPIATDLERLGLPVDLLLIPNLRHPFNLFRVILYLKLHRPQILHTQLGFSDILGTLAAKVLGIPVVSTLHTLDQSDEHSASSGWRLKLRWFILGYFSDQVIAVSEKTRQHHIENAKIKPQKIITLYNGIELARFKQTTPDQIARLKQELGIPNIGPIIITVAVLREPKGIQFMIQALPAILKNAPNAHYLVIGDGAYKPALLELVESLGIQQHVTFAGRRTDIPTLLDCADIFVLPTLIDALPTVLIEALAAEKPIIASNVGGIPEIIEDGVNGLLIPAGNPAILAETCLQLLQDKERSGDLALAGRKTVQQRFDLHGQIGSLIEIYETLLERHGKQ